MSRIRIAAVAVFATGVLAATAYAAFPRINAAENAISNAIAQLRAAPAVYGGHKAAAINLLQQAIGQLQAAKAFRH